ncbi:polysaccharide deacetylase [Rhizobium sp. ACO-34A]|nr:polysaccharide deacetylase family protein [Rhizobium sp. ACO-34A]ATN33428.1 polysaccharide deacetylase [Rhizobium sp. ACO-34A]
MSARLKRMLRQTAITAGLEASHVLSRFGAMSSARGRGAIFTLHHVRPFSPRLAEPNRHLEITPEFLEQAILQLKRDGYRFVALDDIPSALSGSGQPFAAFTLDDGFKDNAEHALPVFERHGVPFTIFVARGFAERSHTLWWETLDELVNNTSRFTLTAPSGDQTVFEIADRADKIAAGDRIGATIGGPGESEAIAALDAAALEAGVDARALADRLVMTPDELKAVAGHPLASLGAHTVSHRALTFLDDAALADELSSSADYVEALTGRRPTSFAYPYGDSRSVDARTAAAVSAAGFRLAVTTRPGTLRERSLDAPMQLPRISLNGFYQKPRYVSALASGIPFARRG